VPNDGCLNYNEDLTIGFGRKDLTLSDISSVIFNIVKVSGITFPTIVKKMKIELCLKML